MNKLTYSLEQLGNRIPGGIGRYSKELFAHMSAIVPANWELEGVVPPGVKIDTSRTSTVITRKQVLPTRIISRAWSHGLFLGKIQGNFHSPSLLMPLGRNVTTGKCVATIHDAVPWKYPETLTPHGVKWHSRMLKRALRYADAIAVPSNSVKDELSDLFACEDRLFVIPGAPSLSMQPLTPEEKKIVNKLPERFFLTVGTKEPRKGIDAAFQAARLSNSLPLVHIGPKGWGNPNFENPIVNKGQDQLPFCELGYVSNSVLAYAYKHADALILPSISEGFGLPLVEAMQLGTPGIVSNIPVLREVGGTSVLTADRGSPSFIEELAEHMSIIASDSQIREELSIKALLESQRYSWQISAQKAWNLHTNL